jgi:hypothetical protein
MSRRFQVAGNRERKIGKTVKVHSGRGGGRGGRIKRKREKERKREREREREKEKKKVSIKIPSRVDQLLVP